MHTLSIIFLLLVVYEIFKIINWHKYYIINAVIAIASNISERESRMFLFNKMINRKLTILIMLEFVYALITIIMLFTRYWYIGAGLIALAIIKSIISGKIHKHEDMSYKYPRFQALITIDSILSIGILLFPIMQINNIL